MRFREFESRVDERFDLKAYAEPDGWDFALTADERRALVQLGSDLFRATFNGLCGSPELVDAKLERIHLLVFPERSLIDAVIDFERSAADPGALIVTHHPVDMETAGRGFLPLPAAQLRRMAGAGVGLFVLHAPLDCHPAVSTSRALAEALALRTTATFAPYTGGECGVIAEGSGEAFAAFAERVRAVCELPSFRADAVRYAGRDVRRVAIVAGGGDDVGYLDEAEALGADTYLAGHWWTPHAGAWCDANRAALRPAIARSGMNLLSASHDGSELVVFRDWLAPLFEGWGIETRLWRQADHWR